MPSRIHDVNYSGDRCTNYIQEIWNDEVDILVTTEVTRAHNDGGAANMRFIRASRDLVPALVVERDALRAEVERLTRERLVDIAQLKDAAEIMGLAAAEIADLRKAVRLADMFFKVVMPKMNVGDSFLGNKDISLWNEVGIAVNDAALKGGGA